MLSYQHIYHAGNFADVQKHLALINMLQGLLKSATPITWVDTHAGRGLYNLQLPEAQKLKEYKDGYLAYRRARLKMQNLSKADRAYFKIVEKCNKKGGFNIYPGSAYIAACLLRPCDTLIACELHKGEITHLNKSLASFPHATILQQDGFSVLEETAQKNPHGGVIIDPSYEIKSDYMDVGRHVKDTLSKWQMPHILIWVPLLPAKRHDILYESLSELRNEGFFVNIDEKIIQNLDDPDIGRGLYGSGIVSICKERKQ